MMVIIRVYNVVIKEITTALIDLAGSNITRNSPRGWEVAVVQTRDVIRSHFFHLDHLNILTTLKTKKKNEKYRKENNQRECFNNVLVKEFLKSFLLIYKKKTSDFFKGLFLPIKFNIHLMKNLYNYPIPETKMTVFIKEYSLSLLLWAANKGTGRTRKFF